MYKRNVSGQFIGFVAIKVSDGTIITGTTGFAAYRVLDDVQASATGTVTDKGNGQYSFALSQADTNGINCSILFTMTDMIPVEKTFVTVNGNLITSGTGTDQLSLSTGGVTLADGVNHGGTTSTLTMKNIIISNSDATGVALVVSNTNPLNTDHSLLVSDSDGFGLAVSGTGAGVSIFGGDSKPGLKIYGPYNIPGPAVVIDTTVSGAGVDGGPGVLVHVAGAGNAAILLQSDTIVDAIQVSDGTPISLLNNDGSIKSKLISDGLSLITNGTYDLRQMIIMVFEAAFYSKISGLPNSPAVVRNFADTLDRATIAFDSNDNRISITINNAP